MKVLGNIVLLVLVLASSLSAQNERKFVRNGNKLFMEAVRDTSKIDTIKYSNAETEYRKALNKKPTDLKWNYNLADALYKQQHFEDAAQKFEELADKMEAPIEKARAYHNLGNSQIMNKKLDESIESYKKALRQNPSDLETKYNLAFAQNLKKKQQQQQKQNKNKDKKDNKDKNKKDKNKDQQNKNNDQNKDKNKDKQNQDKQKQNQDQNKNNKQNQEQQKKQQQPQNKISKQDAQQLLQALQNDEKKIQDKVKKAKAAKAKRTRTEKEW